jgi:hypothetical protein
LQQNPALQSEDIENTSRGDKNDLLNTDTDEERREIERSRTLQRGELIRQFKGKNY